MDSQLNSTKFTKKTNTNSPEIVSKNQGEKREFLIHSVTPVSPDNKTIQEDYIPIDFSLFLFSFFLRHSFALSPKLECSGTVTADCNLHLLGSSDSRASPSWVAGTIGVHHHTWLIFVFLVELGFHHVGRAGLELLTSTDLHALAS